MYIKNTFTYMSNNIYNFRQVENKWISKFNSYALSNDDIKRNKYYMLEMLPYPSGKLHMGHIRNYTIGDVVARIKKMQGYNVIHTMGWDSFGMPAENAAIKSGENPKTWTLNNIKEMKTQLHKIGYMYDWNREISTCSSDYYAQEQKLFLQMYEMGLIYRKKSYVNWDPIDQTVLANEQIINNRGWRSGALIEKKLLEQWSIKITNYAEQLLDGLQDLKGHWPDKVIKMQENWIGKSEGAEITFKLVENEFNITNITVFSTRPETIFGMSFIAISPDHEISELLAKKNNEVYDFLQKCKVCSTTESDLEKAEKLGYFTNLYINHPILDKQIPIYIANFVLMDYGTGAIFGCPAHDQRDFDFATKYNLPIIPVINNDLSSNKLPYTEDGILINSSFLNGKNIIEAKNYIMQYLEERKIGKKKTTYRLRDWLISRQRYWGCPIPIIYCPKCGIIHAKPPVLLPEDIQFKNMKGNPLSNHDAWKYVNCPKCGIHAIRETDTLDTFFDSSWYYLRYLGNNFNEPINKDVAELALPVDLYVGGVEHAVLHLLYARFFLLVLKDLGYTSHTVPFKNLLTQGMVCHKVYKNALNEYVFPQDVDTLSDGTLIDKDNNVVTEYPSEKMSKSKKNLIDPQGIIDMYGVDALRLFILSDTPPEKDFEWNTDALDGAWKFLNKIWKTFNCISNINNSNSENKLVAITHSYIKKINETYQTVSLNKAIALMRELFNKIEEHMYTDKLESITFAFETFIQLISPITPFICQEIWHLTHKTDILSATWPRHNDNLITTDIVTIAIQVNGKLRKTLEVLKDTDKDIVEKQALQILPNIIMDAVKRVIFVPNKIINFVS